jgi:hypothetical protein
MADASSTWRASDTGAALFCHAGMQDTLQTYCRVTWTRTHISGSLLSLAPSCVLSRVYTHGRESTVFRDTSAMYFSHMVEGVFPVVQFDRAGVANLEYYLQVDSTMNLVLCNQHV